MSALLNHSKLGPDVRKELLDQAQKSQNIWTATMIAIAILSETLPIQAWTGEHFFTYFRGFAYTMAIVCAIGSIWYTVNNSKTVHSSVPVAKINTHSSNQTEANKTR